VGPRTLTPAAGPIGLQLHRDFPTTSDRPSERCFDVAMLRQTRHNERTFHSGEAQDRRGRRVSIPPGHPPNRCGIIVIGAERTYGPRPDSAGPDIDRDGPRPVRSPLSSSSVHENSHLEQTPRGGLRPSPGLLLPLLGSDRHRKGGAASRLNPSRLVVEGLSPGPISSPTRHPEESPPGALPALV
jgi:hypothetical protein